MATSPRDAFIAQSVWHGGLESASSVLAAHPEIATSDIHTAAILGDGGGVRRFLAADAGAATAKSAPLGWDALTHLCFSKFLRLDPDRTPGFLDAAQMLLAAGASANSGFFDTTHKPQPEWESVLYGAAGVAHHAGLTRLLIEHGAEPNDEEVPYHSPETYDNEALKVLVESGRMTRESLSTMLLRKADWHDYEGIKYLLERGAPPNDMTRWPNTALHQAVKRDNALANVEVMLEHRGDPLIRAVGGVTAVSLAARRGRGDLLDLFETRGIPLEFAGVETLIAACARDQVEAVRGIAEREPSLVRVLVAEGGRLLPEFAGTANHKGVGHLIDLGVDVNVRYAGDGYFEIAPNSTALHVAAWKAWPRVVETLITRGADVNAVDGAGRTPLMLAVKACVDSYWTRRRTPDSVKALLAAGASPAGITLPTGYNAIDALLAGAR